MEVAKMFGVLPASLLRLPLSEFWKMHAYYRKVREAEEKAMDPTSQEPTDGVIVG